MITIAGDGARTNPDAGWDLRGVADDPNPTYACPNGTSLLEMDTLKVFFYDAGSGKWLGPDGEERS